MPISLLWSSYRAEMLYKFWQETEEKPPEGLIFHFLWRDLINLAPHFSSTVSEPDFPQNWLFVSQRGTTFFSPRNNKGLSLTLQFHQSEDSAQWFLTTKLSGGRVLDTSNGEFWWKRS